MKIIKYILFVFVLVVMIFPTVQKECDIFNDPPLNGDFVAYSQPGLYWTEFYTGRFQTAYDQYLEQNVGFHNTLVRLKNQLDYTLFRNPNAEGIVIGKDDYIFEYDYIRQLTGRDYVGMEFIDEKLRRLKYVQNYLKTNHDIEFIIVFMPGKASFYKEFIPDKYLSTGNDSTNYQVYIGEIKKRDIRHIDLNSYFLSIKESSEHPLFPKYGTHWSIYGMSKASMILIDSLELFTGKQMNTYDPDSLYFSYAPLRTDYDGGKALNIINILSEEKFAYPYYQFGNDTSKYKPCVLSIGDSFYWNIFNAGIPKNLFANEAFWYYNNKIYPDFYIHPKYTYEINLKDEVENTDAIFIMVTERFLNIFDWGLIDQLYYLYTPDYVKNPIYDYINGILKDPVWFDKLISDAIAKNKTLENELYKHARHQYQINQNFDFMVENGLEVYKEYYRNKPELELMVHNKAIQNNLSFENMLTKEADYLFRLQKPEIYEKHNRYIKKIDKLKSDSIAMDSIRLLSIKYNCLL